MSITRRDAILRSVAAAIAALGPGAFPTVVSAQADVRVDQFLLLSERLTGAKGLDADIGRILLEGFLAAGHGSALAELVTPASASASPLADAIVAAWYSGVYDTGHGEAVSDFNGALAWSALSFTKPFGSCGGEIGHWADPPEP